MHCSEATLRLTHPRHLLIETVELLPKLTLAMKLLSEDYEPEHIVAGLDLNARFADVYYSLIDLGSAVNMAVLRLHIEDDEGRVPGFISDPITKLDEFMPKEWRDPKGRTLRMRRDWILYRDTRNAVQFWIDAFSYYEDTRRSDQLTFFFRSVVKTKKGRRKGKKNRRGEGRLSGDDHEEEEEDGNEGRDADDEEEGEAATQHN